MAEPAPEESEPDAVTLAWLHADEVAYSWFHSWLEMVLGWDMAHDARVLRGGYVAYMPSTDGLADGRNKAVAEFLDERDAPWLFWVDTDMGFPPDVLDRLLAAADPVERPIVGALAFTQRREESDGMGGWRCRATPTIFDWAKLDDGQMGFAVRWDYPTNMVTRCAGTGSACILIHRSVFERVEAEYGRVWYTRVPNQTMGQVVSEDLSFCLRAGTLDIPVHVHTGVKTSHQKTLWLAEDDYFGQVALSKMTPAVAPATEATAVIVPVLGRPQNAAPFMRSLKASGADLATVYVVYTAGDDETACAWADAGAEIINGAVEDITEQGHPLGNMDAWAHTFAQKVNLGYRRTDEPWLFLTGDDVRFKPGWLDYAQAAARDGYDVVGTNDLHNPRVMSGRHATHLLVRRSYVDEQGASWDGPKVLAHEGYRHWFVDDEWVTVAKQRGAWTPCLRAEVEHLHPLWGGAEDDDTYRLGRSHVEADRALFEERCRTYLGGSDG